MSAPTPLLSEMNRFFHLQACPLSVPAAPSPIPCLSPSSIPSRYTEQTEWDKKHLIRSLKAQQCPTRPIMQPHVQWALGPPRGVAEGASSQQTGQCGLNPLCRGQWVGGCVPPTAWEGVTVPRMGGGIGWHDQGHKRML